MKPTDTKLEFADIKAQIRGWEYERKQTEVHWLLREAEGIYLAEVGKRTASLVAGRITLPRYRSTPNTEGGREWVEVTDGSIDEERDIQLTYIESDSASPDEVNGTPAQKRSWSFQGFYRCPKKVNIGDTVHFFSTAGAKRNVVLKTRMPLGMVSFGAICVNFKIRATLLDGFYMPSDLEFQGGTAVEPVVGNVINPAEPPHSGTGARKDIFCARFFGTKKSVYGYLHLGEWWWNGSAWTTEESVARFDIDTADAEWHSVIGNKTVDFPYNGDAGVFIPVPGAVSGDIELGLYSDFFDYSDPEVNTGDMGYVLLGAEGNIFADIADLSLTYCPEISVTDISMDVATTNKRRFSRNFKEEKNIQLTLHSSVNESYQQSLVYVSDAEVLNTLYIGGVEKKPEQHLLDECERLYARTQKRWRRGMATPSVRPIDVFDNGSADSLLMTGGVTIDYAEGSASVYLSEIKKTIK